MTNTPNYNLLLAEGTDLVNYLTQTNPNFTSLDTIIKAVSDATITTATEVTTGTAHAISRSLTGVNVIRFTATSNWLTGDTMTIDGTPVTPLKTDGTTLKTGDYIIGSSVLLILDGTRVTAIVASSPDAADINYDNTSSGLTANKVQGAIDEINSKIFNKSATGLIVTPDNGTLIDSNVRLFYSDNAVSVNYKIRLNNVTARPSITITNIPNDLPPFSGFGNPTVFSPTGSGITSTDLSLISYDGYNMSIYMENFIGAPPTGYAVLSGTVLFVNV